MGGAWFESEAKAVRGASFRSTAYRPDSTVDGWAAGPFVVRGASVRGDSHRYYGIARQDEMGLAWDEEAKLLLITVADGVSAAPLSHLGASTACRYALECLLRNGSASRDPDWRDLLDGCAWALVDTWQRLDSLPNPDPAAAERQLATTLCVAVISERDDGTDGAIVRAVAVGDSGLAVLREGRIVSLLGGKAPTSDGIVEVGVVPLPRVPDHPATGEWAIGPEETLLIGTDGVWDPVGDGEGAVARLLIDALGRELPSRADYLRVVDFCRETYDDDRTLVAVRITRKQPSSEDGADDPQGAAVSFGFGRRQRESPEREQHEDAEQGKLGD